MIRTENTQRIGAAKTCGSLHYGFLEISAIIQFQQMDDHLCIRFTCKGKSFFRQFFSQLQIVFNDTVVNNGKSTIAAYVGMRIIIRGRSMGSPSCVSDSAVPRQSPSV